MKRNSVIGLLGLLASVAGGALLAAGCSRTAEGSASPTAPPGEAWLTPVQVREGKIAVEPVAEHAVGGSISASGRITFDDQLVTHVYSPVSGRVISVDAALGRQVHKGAPLAVIDSPDLGSAYSDVMKAQADVIAAQHDFQRKGELLASHAASRFDYEQAEDNFRKAKAEFERARLKAHMLSKKGSTSGEMYTLRAPIDGKVITRTINPGLQVSGVLSGGTPTEFFTIGELKRVWVMTDVYEMDLASVKKGAKVEVSVITYPKKNFEGTVDWVASALDPALRTAKVRCIIDNAEELLKPEMYATVKVSVPRTQALAVYKDAVLHLGDHTVVFVQLSDGPGGVARFERRPISLQEDAAGDYLAVEHGLEKGDRVVVSGAILISGAI